MTVAPNSPKARSQASSTPAATAGSAPGSATRRKRAERAVPERGGDVLERRVLGGEGRAGGDHEERRRHEGLGEDDAPAESVSRPRKSRPMVVYGPTT